jgi:hypothetical protein
MPGIGGRLAPEPVDALDRNQRTDCSGIRTYIPEPEEGDAAYVIWAMLHAAGGSIQASELGRALQLLSEPSLLVSHAPADRAGIAREWAALITDRAAQEPGMTPWHSFARMLNAGWIVRDLDDEGRVVVRLGGQAPSEPELESWFRFQARLALEVLAALPEPRVSAVDESIRTEDRALLRAIAK